MIPLTVRSGYSLLWGTSTIPDLCRTAEQRGFRGLALTDTDNLYGLWEFLRWCDRTGLRPVVGAELTDRSTAHRAVCLAENADGFRNLCRLLSHRHRNADFSLAKEIGKYRQGLIILTTARDLLASWQSAGVDVAAALPRKPSTATRLLREEARRLGLPSVAVPGCFFLEPPDHETHRLLRAIAGNTTFSLLPARDAAPADAWLASEREYRKRFEVWPETLTAGERIAERLTWKGPDRAVVMPPWEDPGGLTAEEVLRTRAYQGARKRYGEPLPPAVTGRLEHELAIIGSKGFASYFLVVEDIVRRSPRICGRGSGAASLVAYSLEITNVCPLKFHLYFERFLNPGRRDPPDIDVDFAWDERDGVLESVLRQYAGRSAMVCNHVFFQPRMAIRETAKVFGLPEMEIKQFMKRLPWVHHPWGQEREDNGEEDLLPADMPLDYPVPWPEVLRLAHRILGLPRNLSVHPGGMIITPGPIEDFAPVESAPKGVPIIQWEKDGAEESGLVKIDLLGNRSLAVIRDALSNVRSNGGAFDDFRWEPEEDPPTRERVARGDTMGCFYIESPATRLLQKKAEVGDFEHLVIHSSIIRPAANPYIQEYLRRLKGGAWQPLHPLLGGVLEETYGIMVYQEDVSRAAMALAGFSAVDADGLRKVLSKKDKELALRDYQQRFRQGALRNGATEDQVEAVWQMILSFSGYSFCKSHSASYARVSFQAAYLKTHFPAEFMAAVISNQGGFYSTFAYVSETRRLGLTLDPPDVNRSGIAWRGQGTSVRVGLMSVKDLSQVTRERIVQQRELHGGYRSLEDFLARARPAEDEVRALIDSSALDRLHPGSDHAELLWRWFSARKKNPAQHTMALFQPAEELSRPDFPAGEEIHRLRRQFAVLGFLVHHHPILLFPEALSRRDRVQAREIPGHLGRRIRMAGWLITGKTVFTSRHELMQFLTFEDETGLIETVFFPDAYRRLCRMLDWGRPYQLCGRVEENFGAFTLTVEQAFPLAPGTSGPATRAFPAAN